MSEQLASRVKALEDKMDCMDKKIDTVLEVVAVGKAAGTLAKWMGGLVGFSAAALEIYRSFFHKG